MRQADVIECAALGYTPKRALRHALSSATEAWTAKRDGRAEAMFGLTVTNALCGHASPWMLGTEAIYAHPKEMIRGGERVLARWLDSISELSVEVWTGNHRALRLLRRWGFELEGGDSSTVADVEFARLTLSR